MMAARPVFVPDPRKPFARTYMTEFQWNPGLSAAQKRRNIDALHEAHRQSFPQHRILEISSKSKEKLGVQLSAFHLKKYVPQLEAAIPLECVFQGGKVFSGGGPYTDLYDVAPRDAKRDPRLRASGELKAFFFDGRQMPTHPTTAFYDWLYITALLENPELAEEVVQYDAFTDIEFNPAKSLNCQASAASLFVALHRQGRLEQCRDFDGFLAVLRSINS